MSARKDLNDFIDNVRDELPSRVHSAFEEAVQRAEKSQRRTRKQAQHSLWSVLENNLRPEDERREEGILPILTLVIGLIGGAALMYLFDPERGERRRALIRDQVSSAVNDASDSLEGAAKDVSNRVQNVSTSAGDSLKDAAKDVSNRVQNISTSAGDSLKDAAKDTSTQVQGAVKEAKSQAHAAEAGISDQTLQARVRAQLGHYVAEPTAISVTINNGTVTLGGKLRASEAQPLIERVRTIPGVKDVENRLELHDSADNITNTQNGTNSTNLH